LPANVQAIIAAGGLESWCREEIERLRTKPFN